MQTAARAAPPHDNSHCKQRSVAGGDASVRFCYPGSGRKGHDLADIFISYKSERRSAARHLAKILNAYGYDVWYDYGLIPGHDFEPRLMAELAAAKVVVVLWCSLAVRSDWVSKEAREARYATKYLPCWIESADLPQEFARADTINLSEWDGAPRSHMLDRLLGDIARRLGRNPSMDFNRLRDLDEDWRGYGAPSLAHFALGKALTPEKGAAHKPASPQTLATPPAGLSPNLAQHWENARQGDAYALINVGWNYQHGLGGLPRDEREAVRLYKLAADQGDANGQSNLGVMYEIGLGGLRQDEREAVRLYKLAADQGYAIGQNNLGSMYREGRGGLPQDDREAVRLYKLAAEQGKAVAQNNLGFMYANGCGGLPQDDREAVRLYKLAVEQGSAAAQANLGIMYANGLGGLPHDDREAVRLYKLAAEQGDDNGQANLGFMYANGRGGLLQDDREAVRLYTLAAQQGNQTAQGNLRKRGLAW